MPILQIHEGKKLPYKVLQVYEGLCEPEKQSLYLKNPGADPWKALVLFHLPVPVLTFCFSSDNLSMCSWKSDKATHAGHIHL